ncbi:MAG: AMP-binding protein [Lachnospiraceae bacterium]|nr:AMP-binding protein [Lachnospiraceae bacterium]
MDETMNGAMKLSETKTLYDLLENAGRLYGDKVFLKYEIEEEVFEKTYAEFVIDAKKTASFVKEKKEENGGKIHAALLGRNSYEYLCSLMGTVSAGGVAIPLDVQLSNEELVKNLSKADTDILFYDWEFSSQASYIMEHCDCISHYICLQEMKGYENIFKIFEQYDGTGFVSDVTPESVALIIFTSGTTGDAKGVMLSHANEVKNTFASDNEKCEDEVILGLLPIHHVFCINCDVFMVIRYGNTLCICKDLKWMLRDLHIFEPTYMRVVPMMAKSLLNRMSITRIQNPEMTIDEVRESVLGSKLTTIASGGGYLSKDIAMKFREYGVKIAQGYGMSECSPKISVPDYDRVDKLDSVGFLVRECEVRIVDGEIRVKSPCVMLGYYKDEEKTRETITEDGWLCTGDLGYLDEDGFLYLTGRKKNLIILANGENVSPEGIENLFDEDPIVTDILVFSQDEKIVAEVYPNFEYAQVNGIDDIEGEVKRVVEKHNETLPTYSKIFNVTVRKHPFKKTSSKKIIRSEYFSDKKQADEKSKSVKKPENELQQSLYDLVKAIIGNDSFGIDENLFEQGLDSLGSFMLIEDLQSKLDRVISYNELMTENTIEKLERFFLEKDEAPKIDYTPRKEYPLTAMQMYFGYIIRGNTTGNLPFTFKLDDSIDLERLQTAIVEVLDAHPGVKGKIYADGGWLKLFRDDERKIEIPIEKLSEAEWEKRKEEILVPFAYTKEDDLFHIRLFQTETSKYMLFDVSHIMGDGMTMNILLEDLNNRYLGRPIEKETYTFFEYIIDDAERVKNGVRKKNIQYYDELLKGIRLSRSVLNKKEKEDLSHEVNGVIRKTFDKLVKKEILYFCKKNGISENVLFLTAFNYTVSVFSDEKDLFTNSIHSGRTDGRWRRLAGPLFLTYFSRYNVIPHETTVDLLRRSGRQIMDTMKCEISVPREGEMFFQYQADIISIPEIGGAPAEQVHLQLDSLPFHMQVMTTDKGYYTELRYWKNRFDESLLSVFLTCYENVLWAMTKERSARRLKKHMPEEVFPKHYKVKVKDLAEEAQEKFFADLDENEYVKAYVLDEHYYKKPFGAWGRLYIMDQEPIHFEETINYPEQRGHILYDTGITARILPDGRIDFLENSGRTVLTDGAKGRRYYDLGALEKTLSPVEKVKGVHAYLVYDNEANEMRLEMDVDTVQNSFINQLRTVAGENLGQQMVPTVVNLRIAQEE